MLVLLYLSAAFDTIDHEILLKRLSNIGISGVAHDWFRSYLLDPSQSIYIKGTTSKSVFLKYRMPQGSVMGPVLFTQYTVPIGVICRRLRVITTLRWWHSALHHFHHRWWCWWGINTSKNRGMHCGYRRVDGASQTEIKWWQNRMPIGGVVPEFGSSCC